MITIIARIIKNKADDLSDTNNYQPIALVTIDDLSDNNNYQPIALVTVDDLSDNNN